MFAFFLCLQVEEEPESRGGRRRTWDDEHVLKRQFSALVPAFDPRPGRTNIAQTQDIVIPAPGKTCCWNSKCMIHTFSRTVNYRSIKSVVPVAQLRRETHNTFIIFAILGGVKIEALSTVPDCGLDTISLSESVKIS